MKTRSFKILNAGISLALAGLVTAHGASFLSTPGALIPDNEPAGITDTISVSGLIGLISDMEVMLRIEGTTSDVVFNGDLFASLTHDAGYSVLLNRVGVTLSEPLGFTDPGFNITLDDEAATDVHAYSGGGTLSSPLTGSWQPDGRDVDPDLVLDTDARTAMLGVFDGLDANGQWTLRVADYSEVFQGKLVSWGVRFHGVRPDGNRVPDVLPGVHAMVLGLGMLGLVRRNRS